MSTHLFAFLGTGNYESMVYTLNGNRSKQTRYIQRALLDLLPHEVGAITKVTLFMTEGANAKHGEGVRAELAETGVATGEVAVPDGTCVDEIWDIFERIYNEIEEESTILFDITHSFRSLPMLSLVTLFFARTMKRIEPRVYYGAYEAREDAVAPVFDLTEFFTIVEWSNAIEDFIRFGRFADIHAIIADDTKDALRESKGKDVFARAMSTIARAANGLSDAIRTCRSSYIYDFDASKITGLAGSLTDDPRLRLPHRVLIERLEKKTGAFKKDDVLNGLRAAEWCEEHGLVQQGITLLAETIVTYVCTVAGRGYDAYRDREPVTKAIQCVAEAGRMEKMPERREELEAIAHYVDPPLAKAFHSLYAMRNDINHAGLDRGASDAKKFHEKLREALAAVRERIAF